MSTEQTHYLVTKNREDEKSRELEPWEVSVMEIFTDSLCQREMYLAAATVRVDNLCAKIRQHAPNANADDCRADMIAFAEDRANTLWPK